MPRWSGWPWPARVTPRAPIARTTASAELQQPGEEFPTGHLHPPAHPGCRCLLDALCCLGCCPCVPPVTSLRFPVRPQPPAPRGSSSSSSFWSSFSPPCGPSPSSTPTPCGSLRSTCTRCGSKLFEIKAGLMVTFAVIFAVLLLASLMVAERLAPKGPSLDAEDEFVKRYQEVIGPYPGGSVPPWSWCSRSSWAPRPSASGTTGSCSATARRSTPPTRSSTATCRTS